jgi:hypothetical protein
VLRFAAAMESLFARDKLKDKTAQLYPTAGMREFLYKLMHETIAVGRAAGGRWAGVLTRSAPEAPLATCSAPGPAISHPAKTRHGRLLSLSTAAFNSASLGSRISFSPRRSASSG